MRIVYVLFALAIAFKFGASEDFLKNKETNDEEASTVAGIQDTDVSGESSSLGLEQGELDSDQVEDDTSSNNDNSVIYHTPAWYRNHNLHTPSWYRAHGIYHSPEWYYNHGIYSRPRQYRSNGYSVRYHTPAWYRSHNLHTPSWYRAHGIYHSPAWYVNHGIYNSNGYHADEDENSIADEGENSIADENSTINESSIVEAEGNVTASYIDYSYNRHRYSSYYYWRVKNCIRQKYAWDRAHRIYRNSYYYRKVCQYRYRHIRYTRYNGRYNSRYNGYNGGYSGW